VWTCPAAAPITCVCRVRCRGEPDFNYFACMVIGAKQQAALADYGGCRLGLGRFAVENGRANGTRRQWTKPVSSSLFNNIPVRLLWAAQYVLNVFLERVIIIMKRDEFVAVLV